MSFFNKTEMLQIEMGGNDRGPRRGRGFMYQLEVITKRPWIISSAKRKQKKLPSKKSRESFLLIRFF